MALSLGTHLSKGRVLLNRYNEKITVSSVLTHHCPWENMPQTHILCKRTKCTKGKSKVTTYRIRTLMSKPEVKSNSENIQWKRYQKISLLTCSLLCLFPRMNHFPLYAPAQDGRWSEGALDDL